MKIIKKIKKEVEKVDFNILGWMCVIPIII